MLLGPINVRANRQDVQLKVKEEYYSFRDRTAYLFLFFPSLLLVLRSWVWDGCFLALPVQIYQKGIQLFLRWAIMQGVEMLLQNRYQRQRLYTRIALGKVHDAGHMVPKDQPEASLQMLKMWMEGTLTVTKHIDSTLTRAKFEELCLDLLDRYFMNNFYIYDVLPLIRTTLCI